jgi:putative peptide zinc metalloprotease protein
VCVPLGKFLHYLATSTELMRVRYRAIGSTAAFAALLVGLIGLVPVPDRYRLEGVVQPLNQKIIYSQSDGFVTDVLPSGRQVSPDDPLPMVTAENRALERDKKQLLADLDRLEAERLGVIADVANSRVKQAEIDSTRRLIELIDQRLSDLKIRAPLAGTWVSPECDQLKGSYIKRGDAIGQVADLSHMVLLAYAPQNVPMTGINIGDRVEIRVKNRPPEFVPASLVGLAGDKEMRGRIYQIAPSTSRQLPTPSLGFAAGGGIETDPTDREGTKAVESLTEIRVAPDDSSRFLIGQRVEIRVSRPDRPLAEQWYLWLRQLIQRRLKS